MTLHSAHACDPADHPQRQLSIEGHICTISTLRCLMKLSDGYANSVHKTFIFTSILHVQGQSLWARLSASHGYLNKQGYCDGGNTLGSPSGNCHLFPVIWGETGTGFTVSYLRQHTIFLAWPHSAYHTLQFQRG